MVAGMHLIPKLKLALHLIPGRLWAGIGYRLGGAGAGWDGTGFSL